MKYTVKNRLLIAGVLIYFFGFFSFSVVVELLLNSYSTTLHKLLFWAVMAFITCIPIYFVFKEVMKTKFVDEK